MRKLTFAQVAALVQANNHAGVAPQIVMCMAWMESSFNADEKNPESSALGILQVTRGAVEDVNKNTPRGVHFEYEEMTDPAKNIACATYYLALRIKWAKGNIRKGIAGYGTGEAYADKIVNCADCLSQGSAEKSSCLDIAHS